MSNKYISLVTSQHRDRPRFIAVVEALTGPLQALQDLASTLPRAFDVDHAVGAQLDATGRWIGVPREVVTPITDSFFSFDVEGLGWNQGSWKGPFVPSEGITVLDDMTYRVVLKARIAKSYWQGDHLSQTQQMAASLAALGLNLVPVDNYDMSFTLHVQSVVAPPPVIVELINREYIVLKPLGVKYNVVFSNVAAGTGPFALDSVDTGLDAGFFL